MALLTLMRLLEEGFKDCNTKGNASWYEPRLLLDEAHLFHTLIFNSAPKRI